ncbi:MAG: type II secretion system protein GspD [Flavobacteriaceae bacterium]
MKLLKKYICIGACSLLMTIQLQAQQTNPRIQKLSAQLDSLKVSVPGLLKTVDFSITTTELTTFLKAIASTNNINISIDASLKQVMLSQSFSDATVKDVLLYICKEHQLTIEILGNILVIKKHKERYVSRVIPIEFNAQTSLFSIDLQNDSLPKVLKKITNTTGKNLVYTVGLEGKKLSGFIKEKSFDKAIDMLALTNNLKVSKTKDGFYVFENNDGAFDRNNRPIRNKTANFYFKVKDTANQILEVDFIETPIEAIINDIGYDLNINMATSKQLKNMGKTSVKSDSISFNTLLTKILADTKFAFKKENGMYFFGEKERSSVRNTVSIPLMHRSIQMMMQPMQSNGNNALGATANQNNNFGTRNNSIGGNNFGQNNSRRNIGATRQQPFADYNNEAEALLSLFPKVFRDSLKISTDIEHNSFIVSGDALKINQFKEFLSKIDKPVPVILIEVMIIEVNKSLSFSAGLDLGIGENPVSDGGTILDGTDGTNLTLGARSINNIIGGLSFGSGNLGKVVPNFYARIQALETNGDINIKSTPKLSTLNGHEALLTNGTRSYYKITQTNTIGTQNPQVVEAVDYIPTDANLSIKIRPIISGDGNITMSINVLQSSFNADRIAADAPPGIDSREFTSTIRVKNKDVIILGGLEVDTNSKTGSGVPFLARIPLIKYLFSKRTRTKSNRKLSVLIKPTIIGQ